MSNTRYRIYLCGGPHCAEKGGAALRSYLERELWQRELDQLVEVQSSGCQDHCDYGPNMTIWPGPYRYVGLTPDKLVQIIEQHLRADTPVLPLLATPAMRRS